MLAEVAVPDQGAAKKMTPGRCTKKIHPGSPEVTFSGNRYIICPKPPSPAGKLLDRRRLFFQAVPP